MADYVGCTNSTDKKQLYTLFFYVPTSRFPQLLWRQLLLARFWSRFRYMYGVHCLHRFTAKPRQHTRRKVPLFYFLHLIKSRCVSGSPCFSSREVWRMHVHIHGNASSTRNKNGSGSQLSDAYYIFCLI